jgi:hypothetical protein
MRGIEEYPSGKGAVLERRDYPPGRFLSNRAIFRKH